MLFGEETTVGVLLDKGVLGVIVLAGGYALWRVSIYLAERVIQPLVSGWLEKMKADAASSQQMSAVLATLGLNVVQIDKTTATSNLVVQAIQAEMRTDARYKRILLGIWKKFGDKLGVDVDEEIGAASAILDDGSAVMRAITTEEEANDRKARSRKL